MRTAGLLGFLLLLALNAAGTSAASHPRGTDDDTRDQRKEHLRELMIGMHNYHSDYAMPSAATHSREGKPLLSWRVTLLPYLQHEELYKRFKLDEPWDSEHNKKLLEHMPDIFIVPGAKDPGKGMTYLQVFTYPEKVDEGKKEVFRPAFRLGAKTRAMTLGQITVMDGTSNTLGIAESGKAVPWTKPEDMLIAHDEAPLPALGCVEGEDDFAAVFLDGSTRFIRRTLKDKKEHEKLLRQIIGVRDGFNEDVSPIVKR